MTMKGKENQPKLYTSSLMNDNKATGNFDEVRWKKWTPKSAKRKGRRCQDERYSTGTLHEGVSGRGSEDGVRREHVITGGSPAAVIAAFDVRELGQGA